jgi:predicted nucleic acid-binding protein
MSDRSQRQFVDTNQTQERFKLSFWDAMIVTSALQLDCRILWSEDLNSGQYYEQLQVVNPFAMD